MPITAENVRDLREKTGAGMMDCKRALEETGGDEQAAIKILREKGQATAAKRESKAASEGRCEAYIHAGGQIGVLVELNCETDFVARNEAFRELAHDIAMQVASMNPSYVDAQEIPEGAEGHKEELALLSQPFIKDPKRTIGDLVAEVSRTTGEVVRVRRFARFELGQ